MTGPSNPSRQVVWLNGEFVPAAEARISILDRGFLFGDGLFETMRGQNGGVIYLRDHLDRLAGSAASLRIQFTLSPRIPAIATELLKRNKLLDEISRVKIIVTRGAAPGLGLPERNTPTLLITAEKYIPPAETQYETGWRLMTYRQGYAPPLAAYKSLNYLYFLAARQAAADAGADEALILDPNGLVTETAAGSVLARTNGRWWTPENEFQLPGTALNRVVHLLERDLQLVEKRPAALSDLKAADTVWILNSLMGIMPVRGLDDKILPEPAADEATGLRQKFFRETD